MNRGTSWGHQNESNLKPNETMKLVSIQTAALLGMAAIAHAQQPPPAVPPPQPGVQQPAVPEPGEPQPLIPPRTDQRPVVESHFAGAMPRPVDLAAVNPNIRGRLQIEAVDGSLSSEATLVNYGGQEVIRARIDREGQDETYVFVNMQGEVVKTQDKVEPEAVPDTVRKVAEQQQEDAAETELFLEEARGQSSYVLKVEREAQPTRWMQIDETGNVVKTHTDPADAGAEEAE
jgi:hypothetical protein